MKKLIILAALFVSFTAPAFAAKPVAHTAVAPVTASTATAAPATTTEPAAAPAPAAQVAAPAAPAPQAQPVQEKSGGWLSNIFGKKDEAKTPAQAAPAPVVAPTPTAPVATQHMSAPSAPPATVAPARSEPEVKADPEQVLRGKVWASESACKKEALKGTCTPLDCATHTGGACSGATGTIWLYR